MNARGNFVRAIALWLTLAPIARAQTPAPDVPWDSAVLEWSVPTEYEAGGSLSDLTVIAYMIEVLPPGKTTWGTVAVVRGVITYRFDNLSEGLWSFRVRSIINGAAFSKATPIRTKLVAAPRNPEPVMEP